MLSVTRKMFRWAVRQGIISISPVQEIDAPGGRETARERALSDQEMGEFWRATELLGYPYGPLSRLLLVTGQRCSEVAGMRDSEMEDGAKLWTIPRERTKNKLTHEVPLSQLALDILASLPAPADDDNPPDCLFISGNRGDTPVRQFKDAKAKLDKLILAARREALRNAGEDPAKAAPMAHWTLHDLRRTMRTNLSKLRLDPEICERIINHVPAGVRRTYDVHAYREEKREALTAWAVRLQQILAAKPVASGKVVRMRPAAQ
jgi:integrase